MIVFYTFLGLVLIRLVLVTVGALLLVRPVRACPACFEPTVPLVKHVLDLLAPRFEWRWCPHCGWQGPARRVRHHAPGRANDGNRGPAPV